MTKEKINFLIKVNIKDSDGKVRQLSKEQEFELKWVYSFGEEQGILNPGEARTYTCLDGSEDICRPSKGEIVQFEKDGKKYSILVKFAIKKGFFKDRLSSLGFEPQQSDFSIHYARFEGVRRSNEFFNGNDWEASGGTVKPLQKKAGVFIVLFIALLLVGGIVALVIWIWKRKKSR